MTKRGKAKLVSFKYSELDLLEYAISKSDYSGFMKKLLNLAYDLEKKGVDIFSLNYDIVSKLDVSNLIVNPNEMMRIMQTINKQNIDRNENSYVNHSTKSKIEDVQQTHINNDLEIDDVEDQKNHVSSSKKKLIDQIDVL